MLKEWFGLANAFKHVCHQWEGRKYQGVLLRVWEDTDSEEVVNNCETKTQRPLACMGNWRKKVGVHCTTFKPEAASGRNECMDIILREEWQCYFWGQWPPSVVLPLCFSWRRSFRKGHCILKEAKASSYGWSFFPWNQEHNSSMSKGNYGYISPTGAGPGKSPQSFIMKTSEQNLGSQQTTDGQGIKAELMPKWLTRAVDVRTQAEASKSHSPVTGTCATSYWNTSGSHGNAPKRMLTN